MDKKDRNKDKNLNVVISGMEDIIKRDLDKHKAILKKTKEEYAVFRESVSYLIKRKRHYIEQKKTGKYNDESMQVSIDKLNIEIRKMSDKSDLANKKIKFEDNIVKNLILQLDNQLKSLRLLNKN